MALLPILRRRAKVEEHERLNELQLKLAELSLSQKKVKQLEVEIEAELVKVDRLLTEIDNLREAAWTGRRK
jgi:hypothetical protein